MIIKSAQHPSGQAILFKEEGHQYISDGELYQSATGITKKLFPEFKQEEIAKKIAKKTNGNFSEIIKGWEKIAEDACEHGKRVHAYIENSLLGQPADNLKLSINTQKCLDQIVATLKERYVFFEPEKIIFSPELGVAGTIDLFGKRRNSETYVVLDWKTNKSIEKVNTFNKFGLGLFSHVADLNYYHYSLQLSTYKELLLREGYVPPDAKIECIICHISSLGDGIYKNYQAQDFGPEIRQLFEIIKKETQSRRLAIEYSS